MQRELCLFFNVVQCLVIQTGCNSWVCVCVCVYFCCHKSLSDVAMNVSFVVSCLVSRPCWNTCSVSLFCSRECVPHLVSFAFSLLVSVAFWCHFHCHNLKQLLCSTLDPLVELWVEILWLLTSDALSFHLRVFWRRQVISQFADQSIRERVNQSPWCCFELRLSVFGVPSHLYLWFDVVQIDFCSVLVFCDPLCCLSLLTPSIYINWSRHDRTSLPKICDVWFNTASYWSSSHDTKWWIRLFVLSLMRLFVKICL